MNTNTLLLIGAGILGALLAVLLLIRIIKGILQMAYLVLVLGASGFLACFVGTPEGSKLLPQTITADVRLIQAGIVIAVPLILSLIIAMLVFVLRSVFKSKPKRQMVDVSQTPVSPFHPPTPDELARMQQSPPPPQQQYPSSSAPTIQNMPPPPTRPNPTRRDKDR